MGKAGFKAVLQPFLVLRGGLLRPTGLVLVLLNQVGGIRGKGRLWMRWHLGEKGKMMTGASKSGSKGLSVRLERFCNTNIEIRKKLLFFFDDFWAWFEASSYYI